MSSHLVPGIIYTFSLKPLEDLRDVVARVLNKEAVKPGEAGKEVGLWDRRGSFKKVGDEGSERELNGESTAEKGDFGGCPEEHVCHPEGRSKGRGRYRR